MRRREFITLLSGAAAWPLAARAQERMRRIGVLMHTAADEPESQARLTRLHAKPPGIGVHVVAIATLIQNIEPFCAISMA